MARITQDFIEQFQVLLPKNAQPCREVISALLEKMDVDKRSYQIGKTKVSVPTSGRPHSRAPPSTAHTVLQGHALKRKGLC